MIRMNTAADNMMLDITLIVENVAILSHEFVGIGIRINATWDLISNESEVNYLTCLSTAPLSEDPEASCIATDVSEQKVYHASIQYLHLDMLGNLLVGYS